MELMHLRQPMLAIGGETIMTMIKGRGRFPSSRSTCCGKSALCRVVLSPRQRLNPALRIKD